MSTSMQETRRLLQAAAALSAALLAADIPHAFHGSVLTAALAGTPLADVSPLPCPSYTTPFPFHPIIRPAHPCTY